MLLLKLFFKMTIKKKSVSIFFCELPVGDQYIRTIVTVNRQITVGDINLNCFTGLLYKVLEWVLHRSYATYLKINIKSLLQFASRET